MSHPNPSPNPNTRAVRANQSTTAILVLGMHRSGTSAIARVLNLRGADLGRDLLPAKQDNERGFWENAAILALHEQFLRRQRWQWHDLLAPAAGWEQDAPAREFVAGLPAVLEQQFGDSKLLLVKDPRLSLLAPLWIEGLAGMNTRPAFVITIRDPDEVAASLARRDGFASAQSRCLWLQHLVEAERATRGHARIFVHYERLLADWRGELARIGTQLDIAWPSPPVDFDHAVAQFIAPALRHHRGSEGDSNAALPAALRRVYERACAIASDAAPAGAGFDDLLAGYDDWLQLAAPLQRDLSLQQERANTQHAAEIDKARAAFTIREDEIAQARANIDALAAELGEARSAHVARDQLESDLRTALQDRDAQIERARAAFTAKEAEVDAARNNIDALGADLARAHETIEQNGREIEAARGNVEALAAEIARARDAFALKEEEIATAQRALADMRDLIALKDREIDAARTNIDNLVAEIERARQAHATRDANDAALRGTRWFRLGHSLRLIDGDKP